MDSTTTKLLTTPVKEVKNSVHKESPRGVASPVRTVTPRRLKLLQSPCKPQPGDAGEDTSAWPVTTVEELKPGQSVDHVQSRLAASPTKFMKQGRPRTPCKSPRRKSSGHPEAPLPMTSSVLGSGDAEVTAGSGAGIVNNKDVLSISKSPAKSSRSTRGNTNSMSCEEITEKNEQCNARVKRNRESVQKSDGNKQEKNDDRIDSKKVKEGEECNGVDSKNRGSSVTRVLRQRTDGEESIAKVSQDEQKNKMVIQDKKVPVAEVAESPSGGKLPQFTLLSTASGTLRQRVKSHSSVDADAMETTDTTESTPSSQVTAVTPSTAKGKQAKPSMGLEVTPVSSRALRRRVHTPQLDPQAKDRVPPAAVCHGGDDGICPSSPVRDFTPPDIDDALLAALLADSESMLGRRQTRALATTDMNDDDARQRFLAEIQQSQAQIYRVATGSATNSPSHHVACMSSPAVTQRPEPRRVTQSERPAISKERARIRPPVNMKEVEKKLVKSPEFKRKLRHRKTVKDSDSQVTESRSASGRLRHTRSTHIAPQHLKPADIERVTKEINKNIKSGPGGTNVYQEEVSNNTSRFWFYVPVSPGNDPEASSSESEKENEKESEVSSSESEEKPKEENPLSDGYNRLRSRQSNSQPPRKKGSKFRHHVLVESGSDEVSVAESEVPNTPANQRLLRCRSSTASYSSSLRQALYSSQSPCVAPNSSEIVEVGSIEDKRQQLDDVNTPSPAVTKRARFWSYEAVGEVSTNPEDGEVLPNRTRSKSRRPDSRKSMDPLMKEICGEHNMDTREDEADGEVEPSPEQRLPKRQSRRCRTEAKKRISRLVADDSDDEVFIQNKDDDNQRGTKREKTQRQSALRKSRRSQSCVEGDQSASEDSSEPDTENNGLKKDKGMHRRQSAPRRGHPPKKDVEEDQSESESSEAYYSKQVNLNMRKGKESLQRRRSARQRRHQSRSYVEHQSESEDSSESDTENDSEEDEKHREEVHDKSKSEGSRFWYYAPVSDFEDEESNEDVPTDTTETRHTRRRSQKPAADETIKSKSHDDPKKSRRGSKFWYYVVEDDSQSNDTETEISASSSRRRSTRPNKTETPGDEEPAAEEIQQHDGDSDTEQKSKNKKKGSSRFWYYVPEEEEEEQEEEKAPRRTRTRRTLNTTETDPDTQADEKEVAAEKSSTESKPKPKGSKFWYYEAVPEGGSDSDAPVSENDSIQENEQDEELDKEELKSPAEKLEKPSKRKSRYWYYETVPVKENESVDQGDDSLSRTRRARRRVTEELSNEVDESTEPQIKDDQEPKNKGHLESTSRQKAKFWYYVPVAAEGTDVEKASSNTSLGRRRRKASQTETDEIEKTEASVTTTDVDNKTDVSPEEQNETKPNENDSQKQPKKSNRKLTGSKYYEYVPVGPENTKSVLGDEVLEGPRRSRKSMNYAENIRDVNKSQPEKSEKTVTKDSKNDSSDKTELNDKGDNNNQEAGVHKRKHRNDVKHGKNQKQRSKEPRYWFFVVESKDMNSCENLTPVLLDRASRRGRGGSSQERSRKESGQEPEQTSRKKSSDSSSKENQLPNVKTGKKTKKRRRVKLKDRWALASNRSMQKLLKSTDEEEDFEGFADGEVNKSTLAEQDMSYDEVSEVEVSENSEVEWEVEEEEETRKEQDLRRFQAAMPFVNDFSKFLCSPTRKEDDSSDWDDNLEGFVEGQVNQRKESGSNHAIPLNFARITPRKKATPRKFMTPHRRLSGKHRTPHKRKYILEKNPGGDYSAILDSSHLLDISTTGSEDELWVGPVPNDKSKYAKEGTIYKPSTPLAGTMEGKEATPKSYLRTPATPNPIDIMTREKESVLEALTSTPVRQESAQSTSTPLRQSSQPQQHTQTPVASNHGNTSSTTPKLKATTDTEHVNNKQPEPTVVNANGKLSPAVATSDNQGELPEDPNPASSGRRLLKYSSNVKKQFNMTHLPSHAPDRPTTWTNKAASPSQALRGVCLSPLGPWNSISTSPRQTPPSSKQGKQPPASTDQKGHTPSSGKHKPLSPRKTSALPSWMMKGSRRSPRKLSMEGEPVTVHRTQLTSTPSLHSTESSGKSPAKRKKSMSDHPRKKLCLSPSVTSNPLSPKSKSTSSVSRVSGSKVARKLAENTYDFDDTNENDPYTYD